MHPFLGLLKKDYRLSRSNLLTFSVLLVLLLIVGVIVSSYTKQPAGTLAILLLAGFSMIGFIPGMMLSFLTKEGKNQMWLYSPRSSYTLLFSKLLLLIIYQALLQFILIGYLAFSMYFFGVDVYQQLDISAFIQLGSFLYFFAIGIGLYLTGWVTLYWMIYHSLSNYPKVRYFRWLLIILIFFSYNILETLLLKIAWISDLITRYHFSITSNPFLDYDGALWNIVFENIQVPLIPVIYYLLLTGLLYYLSARLLSKKVEV
ncbi:hypothetical protein [Paraliobacillus sediminis]|uniref:hypothetical protein n=1 Tax=Paraliobacillus sediminis TaxID=1885916 RepID=UPI000E3CFF0B|nr:hypothetical protein [Paraliobacillus sediminis]